MPDLSTLTPVQRERLLSAAADIRLALTAHAATGRDPVTDMRRAGQAIHLLEDAGLDPATADLARAGNVEALAEMCARRDR